MVLDSSIILWVSLPTGPAGGWRPGSSADNPARVGSSDSRRLSRHDLKTEGVAVGAAVPWVSGEALLGRTHMIGNHGDRIAQLDHLTSATYDHRFASIDSAEPAAKRG